MRNFDFNSSAQSGPVSLDYLQALDLICHACDCTLHDANNWIKDNLTALDNGKYAVSDVGDLIWAYFKRYPV